MTNSDVAPQTPAEARPSRARGRPSRGERTAQQTRSAILSASLTFFAERGFDAASMRDIAAAVGVEHSLLRYHFGDKSALWRESVSLMIDRLDAETAECWRQSEGAPMVERFKQFLRAYVRYCAAHPEHARVVVQESMKLSDRVEWIVENGVRDQHARLIPVLEGLMRDGHLPAVPTLSLLYTITASAQTIFMLSNEARLAHGTNSIAPLEVERHAEALIALLVREPPQRPTRSAAVG